MATTTRHGNANDRTELGNQKRSAGISPHAHQPRFHDRRGAAAESVRAALRLEKSRRFRGG